MPFIHQATADLKTEEHVEIHISLWKSPPPPPVAPQPATTTTDSDSNPIISTQENNNSIPVPTTIVEAQRRKGDAVTYYKYCRHILSAANGTFHIPDVLIHESANKDADFQMSRQASSSILEEIRHEKRQQQQQQQQQHQLNQEKDEKEMDKLPPSSNNQQSQSQEDSLLALEIAASLLKKDRMDARRLGMETLCLLTDPTKSGIQTALLASKVVLFGSIHAGQDEDNDNDDEDELDTMPPEELGVREAILSLVQFGKLGEYIDFEQVQEEHAEEKEFNALLHNLALAVLANALEVLEQYGLQMAQVGSRRNWKDDDNSGYGVASATAASAIGGETASTNATTFLQETQEISKRELLSTLLNVLGKAESKPHDACLSAQCLRSLFQASKKAKRKARDLNAKQIVNTALDVGRRTHVKLETETKKIIKELERTDDMDNGRNGGDGTNTEVETENNDDEHDNDRNSDVEDE